MHYILYRRRRLDRIYILYIYCCFCVFLCCSVCGAGHLYSSAAGHSPWLDVFLLFCGHLHVLLCPLADVCFWNDALWHVSENTSLNHYRWHLYFTFSTQILFERSVLLMGNQQLSDSCCTVDKGLQKELEKLELSEIDN